MSVNLLSIPALTPVQAPSSTYPYVGNYAGARSTNILDSSASDIAGATNTELSFRSLIDQESIIAGIANAEREIVPLTNPTADRSISVVNQFESYFSIPSLETGLAPDFGLEQAKQLSGQSLPVAKFIEDRISEETLEGLPDPSSVSTPAIEAEELPKCTNQKTPVALPHNNGRIRLPILLREPKIEELSQISKGETLQNQIAEQFESWSPISTATGAINEDLISKEQIEIVELGEAPTSNSAEAKPVQTTLKEPDDSIIEKLLTLGLIQEEQLSQDPNQVQPANRLSNGESENQELRIQTSTPTPSSLSFNNLNERLSNMLEIESEEGRLIESREIVPLATDTKTEAISATPTNDTLVQDTKLATTSSEQMSRNNPIVNDVLLHAQEDSFPQSPDLNIERQEKKVNNLISTKSTSLEDSKAQLEKASNEDLQSKSNDELVATLESNEHSDQIMQGESTSLGEPYSLVTQATDQEQDSLPHPQKNLKGEITELAEATQNDIAVENIVSEFWNRETRSIGGGPEEKSTREIIGEGLGKHTDKTIDLAGDINTDEISEKNEQGNNFSLEGIGAGSQLSSSAHSSSGNFDQGENKQQEQLELISEIKDYLNSQDNSMTVRLPNFEDKIRVKADKGENIALELMVNSELDYQIIKEHLAGLVEHLSQKSGTNIEYFKVNLRFENSLDGQHNHNQSGRRQYQGDQAWENLRRNEVVNLQTERNNESIWVA